MNLIVLAAGQASRLGPLAHPNKALVSLHGKPMIAHHAALARELNANLVVISAHPAVAYAAGQIGAVVVPAITNGPVESIAAGLTEGHTAVIAADTYLHPSEAHLLASPCALVAPTPRTDRVFTCADWTDRHPTDEPVFIGALAADAELLRKAASQSPPEPMGPFLSLLDLPPVKCSTWQDVGDFTALAQALRTPQPGRADHQLSLTDDGYVHKTGVTSGERAAAATFADLLPGIFPRVLPADDGYYIEAVDAPTLAELSLYWDLTPDAWEAIATRIGRTLRTIWTTPHPDHRPLSNDWLYQKVSDRLGTCPSITLNHTPIRTVVHGDPNLTNILYSPSLQTVRLIDPRGNWNGEDTITGDPVYDLAKLRMSWANRFVAIVHDMPDATIGGADQLEAEAMRLADFLGVDVATLDAMQSLILLSAAPLHPQTDQLIEAA